MQRKASAANVSVLSILIGSLLLIACGGSEKTNDGPADVDSGIVVSDAGMTEDDAGIVDENIGYISIPAGSFVLSHETAAHADGDTLTVAAFKLGKTPVTVAEFEKCVEAGACLSEHYDAFAEDYLNCNYCNYNRGSGWKNHSMNCVDWHGAKEYCEWIGGRLPTEEEWEYAATHNGTEHLNTAYPWGDELPTHCGTANYYGGSYGNNYCDGKTETLSKVGTSAVGTYSPAGDSPLGLVDMSGNVLEWTNSLEFSGSSKYILKGGSWYNNDSILRVTDRGGDQPTYKDNDSGFRCAK